MTGRNALFSVARGHLPSAWRSRTRADFFIVSPWFLATKTARAHDAGGVPNKPGRTKERTMMGWYGGGMGPIGWLAMGLFWLLLLGLIVWLVAHLLPSSGGGRPTHTTGEAALEILDRRLANGEIELDAWKEQRAALVAAQVATR